MTETSFPRGGASPYTFGLGDKGNASISLTVAFGGEENDLRAYRDAVAARSDAAKADARAAIDAARRGVDARERDRLQALLAEYERDAARLAEQREEAERAVNRAVVKGVGVAEADAAHADLRNSVKRAARNIELTRAAFESEAASVKTAQEKAVESVKKQLRAKLEEEIAVLLADLGNAVAGRLGDIYGRRAALALAS